MSDITITNVSPLSGTSSVSVGGDLSVYSDFSCQGLTLSRGSLTVSGQSLFQSGFTSASQLTCNATPVSSDHLVTKGYVDGLLNIDRLYYCSSVDGAATETITLEPGNYTFYVEITGVIDCSVTGAITVTGGFSWPSTGAVASGSSTLSTQTGSVRYFDSVGVPIKISNISLTSTTSGTYSYTLAASIGSVYSKDTCTVYVIKNS